MFREMGSCLWRSKWFFAILILIRFCSFWMPSNLLKMPMMEVLVSEVIVWLPFLCMGLFVFWSKQQTISRESVAPVLIWLLLVFVYAIVHSTGILSSMLYSSFITDHSSFCGMFWGTCWSAINVLIMSLFILLYWLMLVRTITTNYSRFWGCLLLMSILTVCLGALNGYGNAYLTFVVFLRRGLGSTGLIVVKQIIVILEYIIWVGASSCFVWYVKNRSLANSIQR